ncbi:NF-YB family protein [Populus alba x Populus x berolinensis]|uniref:NF-YB family protein n=1 Tax=Populus alba x Populus x berolinensis TaxID=444605 RepID=A0AAD6LNF5_9ROSI|nr:NF-YB family protein [Populus alba x Populus x berolinensis]
MEPMDIVGKSKEDASLPKATMTKIIKEMLPPDVRVARDAQDLLIECCVGKTFLWENDFMWRDRMSMAL